MSLLACSQMLTTKLLLFVIKILWIPAEAIVLWLADLKFNKGNGGIYDTIILLRLFS